MPSPSGTIRRVQAHALAKELDINPSTAEALLQALDARTIRGLKEDLGIDGLELLALRPRAFRETFFAVLEQVGADSIAKASMKEALRLNKKGTLSNTVVHNAFSAYGAFLKHHGNRVSGDFLSRFWRASTPTNTEALAELRLAEDLLAGRTAFGSIRSIKALEESTITKEQTPEFRVSLPSGVHLAECKSTGTPNKPLTENTVINNLRKANRQLRDQSERTGESEGLIRLDAREAGNTELAASVLAEWVKNSSPSLRSGHTTRWVEIFYKNASGKLVRLVLEVKAGQVTIQLEGVSQ